MAGRAVVSRPAARLDRLEAAALDRDICRAADRLVDAGKLEGWERAEAVEGARRFSARVARHQAAGLGLRAALARVMGEEGLSEDEAAAVLDDVERQFGRIG